jgi:hypothetical protein
LFTASANENRTIPGPFKRAEAAEIEISRARKPKVPAASSVAVVEELGQQQPIIELGVYGLK